MTAKPAPGPIEDRGGAVRLQVRVQPKASRQAIVIDNDGRIRVSLTAPPIDGAANRQLVEIISGRLGVPKRTVRLVGGDKSREKVLEIAGMTAAEVAAALKA